MVVVGVRKKCLVKERDFQKELQDTVETKSPRAQTFGAKSQKSAGNKKLFEMNVTQERKEILSSFEGKSSLGSLAQNILRWPSTSHARNFVIHPWRIYPSYGHWDDHFDDGYIRHVALNGLTPPFEGIKNFDEWTSCLPAYFCVGHHLCWDPVFPVGMHCYVLWRHHMQALLLNTEMNVPCNFSCHGFVWQLDFFYLSVMSNMLALDLMPDKRAGSWRACGPAEMLPRMQNQCFRRRSPSLLLTFFPTFEIAFFEKRELATQFSFLCMSSTVSGSNSWSFAIIGDHSLEVWQRPLTGDTDAAKSSKLFFPSFFFACFLIFLKKAFSERKIALDKFPKKDEGTLQITVHDQSMTNATSTFETVGQVRKAIFTCLTTN